MPPRIRPKSGGLHLVRVGQAEVGPLRHRERHLDVRGEVLVAVVPLVDQVEELVDVPGEGRVGRDADRLLALAGDRIAVRRTARLGIVEVVPHATHHDHVTQVEAVFDEAAPLDRLLHIEIGERLAGQGGRIRLDVVLRVVAADLEAVVPVHLPVEVRPADVAGLIVQEEPAGRPAALGEAEDAVGIVPPLVGQRVLGGVLEVIWRPPGARDVPAEIVEQLVVQREVVQVPPELERRNDEAAGGVTGVQLGLGTSTVTGRTCRSGTSRSRRGRAPVPPTWSGSGSSSGCRPDSSPGSRRASAECRGSRS